jgi:uncharacterized protein (DUF2249 family)
MIAGGSTTLDVRDVAPKDRLEAILGAWDRLAPGDALQLWVDHDPKCMYYTLRAMHGEDAFEFAYLLEGPEDWHVQVSRK